MKTYKLKQWYPSLKQEWSKGDIAEWFDGYFWNKGKVILNGLSKNEVENNPDFWELIEDEEPLFITDDGVDIFLGHSYILIDKEFIKHKQTASNIVYTEYFKKFKHEFNADEYIWRNKPVFSYEEIAKRAKPTELYYLETLAMERSEE